jgi:hypothetical protein
LTRYLGLGTSDDRVDVLVTSVFFDNRCYQVVGVLRRISCTLDSDCPLMASFPLFIDIDVSSCHLSYCVDVAATSSDDTRDQVRCNQDPLRSVGVGELPSDFLPSFIPPL